MVPGQGAANHARPKEHVVGGTKVVVGGGATVWNPAPSPSLHFAIYSP